MFAEIILAQYLQEVFGNLGIGLSCVERNIKISNPGNIHAAFALEEVTQEVADIHFLNIFDEEMCTTLVHADQTKKMEINFIGKIRNLKNPMNITLPMISQFRAFALPK
jgi:hypothetical protein